MNLRPRFLLLTTVLIALIGAGLWLLSQQITLSVMQEWALRHFETQVKLEKTRTLQPIIREVTLARQFADSQVLRAWARQPDNAQLKAQALTEMETFRHNFADQSYFVALRESGDYYHNNAANEFAGAEYRYTLRADNPNDRWFYSIIEQNRDIHLNVNPDIPLGVTKLWIDVLLRDGDNIIGVVGTGLDLTTFIEQVVNQTEPGISNLFFDHEGAIQVSRDPSQINFASITKQASEKKTVQQLLNHPAERRQLEQLLPQVMHNPGQVGSLYLTIDQQRYLAGVIYLPEIDWYEMILLDLNTLLPLSTFNNLFIAAALSLILALLLFHLALNRYILRPLALLEDAVQQLRSGQHTVPLLPRHRAGEVGRLLRHFQEMAASTLLARSELEQKVRERTEALERLTQTDTLTGLLNRRGMTRQLSLEYERLQREGEPFGLIWLDLDHFKSINDHYGHACGDQALITTASIITDQLRPYDHAARWGGDEFLILIRTDDQQLLDQLGERLCQAIAAQQQVLDNQQRPIPLTLSAGSYLARTHDRLEHILSAADKALYQAKQNGRNHYCRA
ncbi:sensor domain-containing diguanylate cyclase [Thalassolituus hydrocarboniclasticus]|uniref:diguanylate cyclase n=1 Tax=Thalassolituus hydrocarboniclasticus TaxID=2742796 RepID=A0ABY6A4F0_9GAMM|nr:sensor domain-containing diguanylate cyclase [Thalassolituus hydrocarboniclasticus]UXD86056.1 GGDEF domain-containing protein [Thalassolituus hydrocarboniclasticus]